MFQLCNCLQFCSYSFRLIRLFLIALPILLAIKSSAFAADADDISVIEKDGVFHISVIVEIAATEEYVRQVLTDYVQINRLSDSVIESKVLESPIDGKVHVQLLAQYCILIFCREVIRVEEISVLESGDLRAVILPEQSDFRSGIAVWKILSMGQSTRLSYIASIEPGFFIPPFLGVQMVVNNMRDELKMMLCRIEKIARIDEAREWHEGLAFVNIDRSDDAPCSNQLRSI